MKKIVSLILTAIFACGALISCGNTGSTSFEPTVEDKKVVMNIDEYEVQYQEFRYYALNNKRDSFSDAEVLSEEQLAELKVLIEENAKYTAAIELLAEKYGAELTKDDTDQLEARVADFRAVQCQNQDDVYLMALEEQFMTDYLFRKLLQSDIIAYNTIEKMRQNGEIKTDDATIDALFESDDLLCIKDIYIMYSDESLKDYARERAQKALSDLEGGMSFAEAMRKYSIYTDSVMPTDHGYYTTEYEMPEYIWNAASSLAEGEYSVIIEEPLGFHIVMRCEKDAEYMEEIREDITERYASAMYTKALYELIDSLTVEYTEYGTSIDLNAMS